MSFRERFFRQFLFIIIAIISIIGLSFYKRSHASEQVVVHVYGDSGYEPYSYGDTFVAKGFYVELLKRIFEKMSPEFKVEIKLLPWKRALKSVENGDVFGVFPPYYHPEERPWMLYSDAIYTEKIYAYCKDAETTFPNDYKEKTITTNNGFIFPKLFSDLIEANSITKREAKDNQQALEYLKDGIAECYANDKNAVKFSLKKAAKKFSLNIFEKKPALFSANAYLGYSKDQIQKFPFAEEFIRKFNLYLKELKDKGEVDQILESFLKDNSDD